jgi:tripartite ATP-independent transporter DctM subunit
LRTFLATAERRLAMLVAAACALVLLGGVGVVFAGVLWRYLLDDPLEWSDETALAVLIATTFLGSALTLQRSEHLGIRVVRNRLGSLWGARADGFAAWVVFAVSACLTWAAIPLLDSVAGQTTVSGLLPASIDYWPVLAGAAAMTVFALFHLARLPAGAMLLSGAVVAGASGLAMLWGELAPAAPGAGIWAMLVVDAACLAAAVPVAFALAAGSLIYIAITGVLPLVQFSQQMQAGVGNYVLLSIPFFVLAGLVMGVNGMSVRLVAFLDLVCGRVRGGLSVVMVVAMAVFSGISGSKSADVAAIGSIMLPAMRRTGYDERDGVALLAASAVMGETIPPCINMIILGYVANVSIGGLFIAGLLPAVVMAAVLILVAVLSTSYVPGPATPRRSAVAVLRIAAGAFTAFLLVLIIVGGIVGGIATPTEVSSVAVLYALVVGGLAFREMTLRSFADFLVRSASLSGMILFIIASAEMLSYLLTVNLIPQQMAADLAGLGASAGPWLFMLIAIVMLVVMGSVLEGAPALIVFGPLLFPAAQKLGIHPLHFGIVLVIAMGIGLFAPPLGVGLYTACAVGGVSMESVARPILKYLAVLAVALLLIAFVPAITLALPRLLGVS